MTIWSINLRMKNPSALLLGIGVVLVVMSVLFTYWKTMVAHDFVVIDDVEEEVESDILNPELLDLMLEEVEM